MKKKVTVITVLSAALFLLAAGTVTALDATITNVSGKVEVRTSESAPWVAAQSGATVPVGATISTSFNATARLQVGESVLEVKPLTRVRIDELISEGGTDRSEINLPVGRISADVRGSAGNRAEFRVRSPIAVASVRGTSFVFDGANLFVSSGVVVLANRFNEAIAVAMGEQSSAAGDAPPQNPVEAAAAAGSVTIFVGSGGERPTVTTSTTGNLEINWRIVN